MRYAFPTNISTRFTFMGAGSIPVMVGVLIAAGIWQSTGMPILSRSHGRIKKPCTFTDNKP